MLRNWIFCQYAYECFVPFLFVFRYLLLLKKCNHSNSDLCFQNFDSNEMVLSKRFSLKNLHIYESTRGAFAKASLLAQKPLNCDRMSMLCFRYRCLTSIKYFIDYQSSIKLIKMISLSHYLLYNSHQGFLNLEKF